VAIPAAGAVVFALLIGMGGLGQLPAWQVAVAGVCAAPGAILGALLFMRHKFVVGGLLVALGVLSVVLLGDSGTPPAAAAAPVTAAGRLAAMLSAGAWIWLYVPPALLASVFPDGRLPSRRWDWLLVGWAVVVIGFHASVALDPGTYGNGPGQVPGAPPLTVPAGPVRVVGIACLGLLLALLVGSVAAVLSRYRHGTVLVRRQIRWFALSVCLLPVVLVAAWACYLVAPGAAGVVVEVGLLALFVTVPVGVAIGVLRHDLYDVDRLLSRTVAYSLLSVVMTAAFSVIVLTLGVLLGGESQVTVAFATALCALAFTPVRRKIQHFVDARVDQGRREALDRMAAFVDAVRDGEVQPEQIETALQTALNDPALRVCYLLDEGDGTGWRDSAGRPVACPNDRAVDVNVGGRMLARVIFDQAGARPQLMREVIREAQLPLEIARSRIELMQALAETRASQARLLTAEDAARRALERDLHDGAQQRLVAIGMSLRLAQGRVAQEEPVHQALGQAVSDLQVAIAELRQLASGVRPSGLDDGLQSALRSLVRSAPVPITIQVSTPPLSDTVTTTAYYVAAEAVANALKHASPQRVTIDVSCVDDTVRVVVVDDGCGGAVVTPGSGLAGLRDRVEAGGGSMLVRSALGSGTRVEAMLPCGS
jgi:signal transduction histidine kinase